jgi:allantoin racemase
MKLAYLHPGRDSDKGVNPEFFKALENAIRGVARPDTTFEILGLPDSVPEENEMAYWYVHPRMFSSLVASAKRAEKEGFDAVVIGCVGATEAEYAIKEVLDIPVAGIGESSLLLAQILGQNFSILTYNNKIAAWIDRLVSEHHLKDKCVSVRPANITLDDALARGGMSTIYRKMLVQASKAVKEDRAEVIINASAGFVGLADHLRRRVKAPIVDAVESGIKFAEMLADLKKTKNLYQSKVACYQPSPNIDRVIEHFF